MLADSNDGWRRTSTYMAQANFEMAENDWIAHTKIGVEVWRWQDKDYVTLVATNGVTCISGVRVPLQKEEWR